MGVSTGDLRSVTWAWSEMLGFFPPEGLTNNVSICNYICLALKGSLIKIMVLFKGE